MSAFSRRSAVMVAVFAALTLLPDTAAASTEHILVNTIGGFTIPEALATDASGNVYVVDGGACRLTRWNAAGEPVDFSSLPGNSIACRTHFTNYTNQFETAVLVAPPGSPGGTDGDIYVTDKCEAPGGCSGLGRVDIYSSDGSHLGEIQPQVSPRWPLGLATGPAKELYVANFKLESSSSYVERYLPSGNPVTEADLDGMLTVEKAGLGSIAVASNGDVYGVNWPNGPLRRYPASAFGGSSAGTLVASSAHAVAIDPATGDLYVLRSNDVEQFNSSDQPIGSFGSGLLHEPRGIAISPTNGDVFVSNAGNRTVSVFASPPAEGPPSISEQHATGVGVSSATLRAKLDGSGEETHYRFQYVDEAAFQANGFAEAADVPVPDAIRSSSAGAGEVAREVFGLKADTTYHFRLVATNSSGTAEGEDTTFTTEFEPFTATSCPNEQFRIGASAQLPDCRAYEMVSPVDKDGGNIAAGESVLGDVGGAHFSQSTPSGEAITYSSAQPFDGAVSGPRSSQYVSTRQEGSGWSTAAISPPQEGEAFVTLFDERILEPFLQFSQDLATAWNLTLTEPVLGEGGIAHAPNVYRRDSRTGVYQGCTNAVRPTYEVNAPQFEGASADQSHAVFVDENALTEDASTKTDAKGQPIPQLYECSFDRGGEPRVRLVSVLPDGSASPSGSVAGTPVNGSLFTVYGEAPLLWRAISADGSRVFWSVLQETGANSGALYVRVNADSEPSASGKCSAAEPGKACTLAVSEAVGGEEAMYWGFTNDGSDALFTIRSGSESPALYVFDVNRALAGEPATTLVSKDVSGVAAYSEDLSRIYFVSNAASSAQQAEGAIAGQPDLYFYEAGRTGDPKFVATVASRDAESRTINSPTLANSIMNLHAARATPNGQQLTFMSESRELSEAVGHYDNTDAVSGRPDDEVYRYDALSGKLACISCNPTGARPIGVKIGRDHNEEVGVWAASVLPGWMGALNPSSPFSLDGSRVFFDSYDALVPADTNGVEDVYEWETASGGTPEAQRANCERDRGAQLYVQSSEGCLSLISSGTSSSESTFVDASATGRDVFILTAQSLVAQDPGLIDIYDAREGGGFASPALPPASCEGEACQGAVVAPFEQTPSSLTFSGSGNLPAPNSVLAKRKALTRAQRLARALTDCRHRPRRKRARCRARARRQYRPKARKANNNRRGPR